MKLRAKHYFSILIILLGLITTSSAQGIQDIIQPIRIQYGKADTILVTDIFYAKDYNLKFDDEKKFNISYNSKSDTIIIQPKNNFIGAALANFTLHGKHLALPVIVQSGTKSQQLYTFVYKPQGKVSKVIVCGSFNNWNKEKDQLQDSRVTGVYELSIPLEPGNYIYKFLVDGKEILDPNNQEKAPTGFDDFNSVLRINDPDSAVVFLHIGKRTVTREGIYFSFYYENTGWTCPLLRDDIIALIGNESIDTSKIVLQNNKFEIHFGKNELKGEKVLRAMVSQRGKTTNIQQIILRNGQPAGKKSMFSSCTTV